MLTGAEEDTGNFLQPMPWVLEMSVNPSRDLRDRSCEHCDDLNPLGAMCCGMCAFWVRAGRLLAWHACTSTHTTPDPLILIESSEGAVEYTALIVQENGRSQSALEKRNWDGPCNERLVEQLLQDLKGWGVDLESFQPKDLFDTIRGRTLWRVPAILCSQDLDLLEQLECFLL